MDRKSKKEYINKLKADRNNLFEESKFSLKGREIRKYIDIFYDSGIKFTDMSCCYNFKLDNLKRFAELVIFYPNSEHIKENIFLLFDLNLSLDKKEEMNDYSFKLFSNLPNLTFIAIPGTNGPQYIYKFQNSDIVEIRLTDNSIKF